MTVLAAEKEAQPAASVSPQFRMIQSVRSDMGLLSAPIRSRNDLSGHIRDGKENGSPIRALSKKGSRSFIASLIFNEEGLARYREDIVEQELSVTDACLVLSLFGAQDDIHLLNHARVDSQLDYDLLAVGDGAAMCGSSGDYMDRQCARRATCKASC